jgi:hypothetical protein
MFRETLEVSIFSLLATIAGGEPHGRVSRSRGRLRADRTDHFRSRNGAPPRARLAVAHPRELIGEYVEPHPNESTALTVALTALARICLETNTDPALVPVLQSLGLDKQTLRAAFR